MFEQTTTPTAYGSARALSNSSSAASIPGSGRLMKIRSLPSEPAARSEYSSFRSRVNGIRMSSEKRKTLGADTEST